MEESHHQPAHKLHYIDWALSAIDVQLRLFNKEIQRQKILDTQSATKDILLQTIIENPNAST
jgi:hypothetical protein